MLDWRPKSTILREWKKGTIKRTDSSTFTRTDENHNLKI